VTSQQTTVPLAALKRWISATGAGTALRSRAAGVWAGGLLVAVLSWRVGVIAPGAGLDASWNAGLEMAVRQGLHFGDQIVFSYGPLGFLQSELAWFGDLSPLSLLYLSALWIGLCVGLVWALRRRLGLPLALLGALAVVTLLFLFEYSLLIAVCGCFWLLEKERSPRAADAWTLAAVAFAAPAALCKLSSGPLVAVLFFVALLGAQAGRRRVLAYVGLLAVALLALWLGTGQSLGDVPAFLGRTWEVSSAYSSSMLRQTTVAPWKVTLAVAAGAVLSLGLLGAAWLGGYRDRRARRAGVVVAALAAFAIYKEGVVRTDLAHITLLFANLCVLYLAVGLGGRRWRWVLAVAVAIGLLTIPVRPPGTSTNIDLADNVSFAWDQARNLVDSGHREDEIESGRAALVSLYALEPDALAALRGHSVAVEPWEVAAAWAYRLDWHPLPIFQNYSAYTPGLDRLNSAAVEDAADGPERILRENQALVFPQFPGYDLDGRYPGWDPPEQARAVLCNFVPMATSERWQVLGRVPDRCGVPRSLGTVDAAPGEAVPVPEPGPHEIVFVRIEGAGVSGLEKLTTALVHAKVRHIVVNGGASYRLIPETAGDGLIMRAGPGVVEPGPLTELEIPEVLTVAVEGSGDLGYEFFAERVSPARAPR
jgi:hypothetical protein